MKSYSELVADRRSAISKDWQTFLAGPYPINVADVIPRAAARLPPNYIPWAPGIVIASDHLLRAAGNNPNFPVDWRRSSAQDSFKMTHGPNIVRKRGDFWAIESKYRALVFSYGSMPICTRTLEQALSLAEYCGAMPNRGLLFMSITGLSGLRWICRSRIALLI